MDYAFAVIWRKWFEINFLGIILSFGVIGTSTTAFQYVKPLSSHHHHHGCSRMRSLSPSSLSTQVETMRFCSSKSNNTDAFSLYHDDLESPLTKESLDSVEFVSADYLRSQQEEISVLDDDNAAMYPFAGVLRQTVRFIADHRQRTAVFYVPIDYMDRKEEFSNLMGDIALSWKLGLKIVLIVGCRFDVNSRSCEFSNAAECNISFEDTDDDFLRTVEEEAGFIRFEVERILNRHLRLNGAASSSTSNEEAPALTGNVIGGNFYVARPFGLKDGVDHKNTGYPSRVYKERIEQALENNNIVLLSTVGTSKVGDLVNVNGHHLAATVAATLQTRKLVYVSNGDAVLRRKSETTKTMQEIPLGFCKAFLAHYDISISTSGLTTLEKSQNKLLDNPDAAELLLHLAWSTWALDRGVNRAHIINPADGSLLEELFTSKFGINTCVYKEDLAEDLDIGGDDGDNLFTMFSS